MNFYDHQTNMYKKKKERKKIGPQCLQISKKKKKKKKIHNKKKKKKIFLKKKHKV